MLVWDKSVNLLAAAPSCWEEMSIWGLLFSAQGFCLSAWAAMSVWDAQALMGLREQGQPKTTTSSAQRNDSWIPDGAWLDWYCFVSFFSRGSILIPWSKFSVSSLRRLTRLCWFFFFSFLFRRACVTLRSQVFYPSFFLGWTKWMGLGIEVQARFTQCYVTKWNKVIFLILLSHVPVPMPFWCLKIYPMYDVILLMVLQFTMNLALTSESLQHFLL